MTCYNLTRIQPVTQLYKTLDDLCAWKTAKHTDIDTGENTKEFEMCVSCTGYDDKRDCYYSHKQMDGYLIADKQRRE